MKNLIMHEKWLNLILSGKKIWDIRSQDTSIRGEIGLAYRHYRYGIATLVYVKKMTLEELSQTFDKHRVPSEELEKYLHGKDYGFAYVLRDVKKLDQPIPIPISRAYGKWIED